LNNKEIYKYRIKINLQFISFFYSCISDLSILPCYTQREKNLKILEEENAQLAQTVAELKNQMSTSHTPPTVSPDSNNATRKLQDEINILTKRNCGMYLINK
jgi:cell division protein FtsB